MENLFENKCTFCGKIFYVKNGDGLRRKYCSKKCRNKRNNNSNNKKCPICRKKINNNSKLCRRCSMKKRDYFGEKNPRFNKGTSAGYIQRIVRESVLNSGRKINVCEKCGINKKPSIFMIIHHIDRNRKNNKPENLIVLCSNCHLKEHKNKYKKELICLECGKSFFGITNQRFCSKLCSDRNYRKNNRNKIRSLWKKWYDNKNTKKNVKKGNNLLQNSGKNSLKTKKTSNTMEKEEKTNETEEAPEEEEKPQTEETSE